MTTSCMILSTLADTIRKFEAEASPYKFRRHMQLAWVGDGGVSRTYGIHQLVYSVSYAYHCTFSVQLEAAAE